MNAMIVKSDMPLIPALGVGDAAGPLMKRFGPNAGPDAPVPLLVEETGRLDVGAEKTAGSNTSVKPQRMPRPSRKTILVLVTAEPSTFYSVASLTES
jgi:hypothetical protein